MYASAPGVMHHGGRGTTATATVHRGWFVCCFHLGKTCSDVSNPKSNQQPTTHPPDYLHHHNSSYGLGQTGNINLISFGPKDWSVNLIVSSKHTIRLWVNLVFSLHGESSLHSNICLYLLCKHSFYRYINSYLCRIVANKEWYWFLHMCENQTWFSESVLDGANLFSFSQFSCEKTKRFAPSDAIPSFLNGVTTRYYVFS